MRLAAFFTVENFSMGVGAVFRVPTPVSAYPALERLAAMPALEKVWLATEVFGELQPQCA